MASLSEAELREILAGELERECLPALRDIMIGYASNIRKAKYTSTESQATLRTMAEVDRRARAEERERCAILCEDYRHPDGWTSGLESFLASAIRSLKDETETGGAS